jgi:anti-anti-sigma factor
VPDVDRLLSVTAVPEGPGRVRVEVVGEVDAYTVPLLELCLQSQTTRREVRELVVDLTRVTFLAAVGLSALVQANHRCARRGARLVVRTGARGPALRTLLIAGLAELLAVDPAAPLVETAA